MQRYRTVIILVLLVVVPLAAAVVAARFLLPGNSAKPGQAEAKPAAASPVEEKVTRKIFVAARSLPVGTLLTEEDMSALDLPDNEIRRGHFVMDGPKAIDELRGHAVRKALAAGTPLIASAVVGPGQRGFLAAALRPGTRAVTIQLGAGTRHAGLIDPGDRVDVILTAKLRLSDGVQSVFTRTILEDVRVVAVDRQVGTSAETADSGKQVKRTEIATATLEVSPTQADRLALGEHEGKLSLAVRSLAGTAPQVGSEAVDLEELLSLKKPVQTPSEAPVAPPPIAEEPATRRVLAASQALTVGTLLREEDLTEIEIATEDVRREHVIAEDGAAIELLRGHAVREALAAGAALTWSSVVGPSQRGFLAAVLKPGTRAVTIRLGAGTSHAGLIDPGDRVDVILTAKMRLADGTDSVLTRRILEDVRVVAVDRQIGHGAGSTQTSDQIKRTQISTATLEVSPAQADRLALGEHRGTLSLAVRSLVATSDLGTRNETVDLQELLSLPNAEDDTVPQPPAVTPPPVKPPERRRVLTASRALPVGTLLKEDDLTELELAEHEIRRGYVIADGPTAFDALRGHATRETVAAGAALTWSSVVGPGQRGFLAAVLKPGTRAVTIQLAAGARLAGLIDPGDRVDVILTAKLKLADGTDSVLTRRILEDVRVVAVDRQLGSGADSSQGSNKVKRTRISTATLEVSPAQADRLALGEHQGTLSLAVRSLATDARMARGEVVNLRQLLADPTTGRRETHSEKSEPTAPVQPVSQPAEAASAIPKTVRIIRGSEHTQQTFPDPAGLRSDAVRTIREPDPGQNPRSADRGPRPETELSR